MLLPLGILNKHLGEKARREALAGSTVKVVGADVIATKKLITTMVLYPFFCATFSSVNMPDLFEVFKHLRSEFFNNLYDLFFQVLPHLLQHEHVLCVKKA